MANISDTHLPNPFTPMAFLSPDQAYQTTIMNYIVIGALSVLIWDILTHLPSDHKLATRYQTNLPTIIYLVSRWSTLLYTLISSIIRTAQVDDCNALTKAGCAVYHVTVSSTALLFFLRVRAVFNRNIYITTGFFALWVVVLGGSLTAVLSATGVHIGNTKYCTFSDLKASRAAVATITLAVFDTCVFIAITWRLSNSELSVQKSNILSSETRFDLFGRYLPAFAKALLHDGQKYYMVAMLANLAVIAMDLAPGIPLPYRSAFWAPAIALSNIMACRVFRHTKLKSNSEDSRVANISTMQFRKGNNTPAPLHIHVQKQWNGDSLTMNSATESEFHIETKEQLTSVPALDRIGGLSRERGTNSVV